MKPCSNDVCMHVCGFECERGQEEETQELGWGGLIPSSDVFSTHLLSFMSCALMRRNRKPVATRGALRVTEQSCSPRPDPQRLRAENH